MHSSDQKIMKNIVKCLLLIFISALFLILMDFLLYPCTFMRNDIHAVSEEMPDVLILGTSAGKMGIDPEVLTEGTCLSAHNVCVGGEYPVDAYYIAKLALEKGKPQQIIFELDPGYLMTEKPKGNNYLLFYHEFPLSMSKLQYFWKILPDCDFRAMFFPFYEYPPSYELSHILETAERKWNRDFSSENFETDVMKYHDNGFIERFPVDEEDFPAYEPVLFDEELLVEENLCYIDKMSELCRQNGIRFTVVIMPLPEETLSENEECYDEAFLYFDSRFAKDDRVEYYDFNSKLYDAVSHDEEDFVDYDGHMNGEAAAAFSTVLREVMGFSS